MLRREGRVIMLRNNSPYIILIFIFLPLQPLLDILTSLGILLNFEAITIGALVRTMIMFFLSAYIFSVLRKHRAPFYGYASTLLIILLSLVVNISMKENVHVFTEISFALKTAYYVTMIFTVITLLIEQIKAGNATRKAVQVTSIIIGGTYWLAILTNTSLKSYSTGARGEIGWFYAANEQSVIVLILLGLILHQLITNKEPLTWVSLVLISSMLPNIGTKTAFLGGSILLIAYLFYILLTINVRNFFSLKNRHAFVYISFCLLYFTIIPFSAMGSGLPGSEDAEVIPEEQVNEGSNKYINYILSSREIYLRDSAHDFQQASLMRKAFGLGHAGDDGKMIEMDFFELFFSYGMIGTIILLTPTILLLIKYVRVPREGPTFILMLTLILTLGISFFAGHVLFAPAVMGHVAYLLFFLQDGNVRREGMTRNG